MSAARVLKQEKRFTRGNSERKKRPTLLRLRTLFVLFIIARSLLSLQYTPSFCYNVASSLEIGWVSRRTKIFTALWSNHKARNIAVYTCVSTRHIFLLRTMVYYTFVCPHVFYNVRYDELFEVPRFCFSHGCLRRYGRSHYIYAEFVLQTFKAVTMSTIEPVEATWQGNIAVLLEPRRSPMIEYTVKQVMRTLGPMWALQVFVSSANEDFVRSCLRAYSNDTGRNIILTRLTDFGLDDMGKYGNRLQSAFSAHKKLYEAIQSEHILWFQLDVVMRDPPKEDWLRYAFIGAEWRGCEYPTCSKHSCQEICGGGNSGLSLRRRSLLLRVATQGTLPEQIWGVESRGAQNPSWQRTWRDPNAHFASDELHNNSDSLWFEDDLQLSYKLSKLRLLPPEETLPRFAIAQALPTEGVCETDPSGLHKPWETPWISPFVIMQLLAKPFARVQSREDTTI